MKWSKGISDYYSFSIFLCPKSYIPKHLNDSWALFVYFPRTVDHSLIELLQCIHGCFDWISSMDTWLLQFKLSAWWTKVGFFLSGWRARSYLHHTHKIESLSKRATQNEGVFNHGAKPAQTKGAFTLNSRVCFKIKINSRAVELILLFRQLRLAIIRVWIFCPSICRADWFHRRGHIEQTKYWTELWQ